MARQSKSNVLCVFAVVFAWNACPQSASAQDADDARFLHVLMVIDTNDPKIGKSVKVDQNTMAKLLEFGVPQHMYRVTVLSGGLATPDNILGYYRKLRVDKNHSMLFYYAGHGAWDTKSHYLIMNGGKRIRRTDIRAAMEKRGAQLNVMLTDCCSTYTGMAAFFKPIVADPYLYRDLFFRHRGTVDITAALKGQIAIGNQLKGGYFTTGLSDMFVHTPTSKIDRNRDGIVTWSEATVALRSSTQDAFEKMRPRGRKTVLGDQTKQTPHVFGSLAKSTGRVIPRSKYRFGITAVGDRAGVRVTKVFPGSPAAWAGIRPGEVLTSFSYSTDDGLNKQLTFKTSEEFVRAVGSVPAKKVLFCFFQNPQTGAYRNLRLRLSH